MSQGRLLDALRNDPRFSIEVPDFASLLRGPLFDWLLQTILPAIPEDWQPLALALDDGLTQAEIDEHAPQIVERALSLVDDKLPWWGRPALPWIRGAAEDAVRKVLEYLKVGSAINSQVA